MAGQREQPRTLILTASLTTGVARVTHGMRESVSIIDEILTMDHVDWETTLSVGDVEFRGTEHGPFPNHQLRISVRPSAGVAALNYMDHDDPRMSIAVISIAEARDALTEWLETRKRPTCIEWRPYDAY